MARHVKGGAMLGTKEIKKHRTNHHDAHAKRNESIEKKNSSTIEVWGVNGIDCKQ